MIVRCVILMLFLNCVRTIEDKSNYFEDDNNLSKFDRGYRLRPLHDVPLLGVGKREADGILTKEEPGPLEASETEPQQTSAKKGAGQIIGQSEGGSVKQGNTAAQNTSDPASDQVNNKQNVNQNKGNTTIMIPMKNTVDKAKENVTTIAPSISKLTDPSSASQNATAKEDSAAIDVNSPGVVKRALIVFGGLTLLAVAYFIFYRNKHKKFEASNNHGTSESNQFRYGVLHSDDRRENLELSRIPLTMESDDDDDEDLEIFDLGQKRKSLSYVNLQTNDEDIVLRSSKDESKNNLLLDIEDASADQLINWSSSGSKSIL